MACEQPYLWLVKAKELRRAADVVWSQFIEELKGYNANGVDTGEPFTGSVAMMLYSFTLENLLKAGLVHSGVGSNPSGKFALKSHKLESMAVSLGIPLETSECELIERLEHFLEWAGRYPIPLFSEELYPRALHDGSHCGLYGYDTGDQARIALLLDKVYSILPSEEEAIVLYANRSNDKTRP